MGMIVIMCLNKSAMMCQSRSVAQSQSSHVHKSHMKIVRTYQNRSVRLSTKKSPRGLAAECLRRFAVMEPLMEDQYLNRRQVVGLTYALMLQKKCEKKIL